MARVSRKNKQIGKKEDKQNALCRVYKVAVYIRLSHEDLEDAYNHKLDNQEQVIMNYIEENAELKVIKVYNDNGYTGTNFIRAAFEELLEDIKDGLIDCVVVKDLSRLGRNYIETEQYISVIFPFLKVRFIAINDNFDSLTCDNDISISLKNIINDAYAKDISRKIYSAKSTQRIKGEFVGNIPPYGYEKSCDNPHKLIINIDTSRVIKKIFSMKEEGKTNTQIAKYLNDNGEIAPMTYWYNRGVVHHEKYANRIWEATTIKVIVHNQMYVGDMVQGKKQKCLADGRTKVKAQKKEDYVIVPNMHEAIISRKQFEQVQIICEKEISTNREKRKRYENVISSENLLDKKIFSKENLKMYRSRNVYEGNRLAYCYVTAKTRKPDGTYYDFCYISEKSVMDVLKKAIFVHIEMLFSIQAMLKNPKVKDKLSAVQQQINKDYVSVKRMCERYRELSAALYKDMVEGIIIHAEYEELKEEYNEKRKEFKDRLENLEQQLKQNDFIHNCTRQYNKEYKDFLKTNKLNKELIDILIKKVTVIGKKEIAITFLFEDELCHLYNQLRKGCSA